MSNELVVVGRQGVALTGIDLPSPPPTRIYLSGYEYKIQAPRLALPPLVAGIKLVLNWLVQNAPIARNILHAYVQAGPGQSTDAVFLKAVANNVMTLLGQAGVMNNVVNGTDLGSVTAKDMSGSTAQATSDSTALVGGASSTPLPPGNAVCVSWSIVNAYRGGKPRTYLPGVPYSALAAQGSATLSPTYAAGVDAAWTLFLHNFNASTVSGTTLSLGTVSYYSGHQLRPVPAFRNYTDVHVHERLDSQRRRSGKESSYQVTP